MRPRSKPARAARPAPAIRPARVRDLPAVEALLRSAGLPLEGLAGAFPGGFSVAHSGTRVIGVAGLERNRSAGLLRSVAVAPGRRGRGVGEALVRDRLRAARAMRLGAVYLVTTGAAAWFGRFGFRPLPREALPAEARRFGEFASGCCASAVAMSLRLGRRKPSPGDLRGAIRERYGAIARRVGSEPASCCGPGPSCASNPISSDLYPAEDLASLPPEAGLASLGCGNPTALAELRPGEVVLDLGSGGGIDVLFSARRVGPEGKAYGLDMTEEMLALARANQRKAGVGNAEFLKGEIEAIPLPDASVDVVVSNCVINLSTDKRRALAEAFRVLRPGGRFAVSDIVLRRTLPPSVRRSAEAWAGCVAGAIGERAYRTLLREAGFERIEIVPTRIHGGAGAPAAPLDGAIASAFVRARKPLARRARRDRIR